MKLEESAFEVAQSDRLFEWPSLEAEQSTMGQERKHQFGMTHRVLEQRVQLAGETSDSKAFSYSGPARWSMLCLSPLHSLEAHPHHRLEAGLHLLVLQTLDSEILVDQEVN